VFSAGISKFAGTRSQQAYRPSQLLHYFINNTMTPNLVVDITQVFERKMAVLRCYRSQFEREEGSVATPLNNGYLEMVEYRERLFGQQAGVTFAEGFVSASPYVLASL
jgi:LmbE family N-acetylglucosaminyl deacetylase